MDHWNDPKVESMYDKTLLGLETADLKAWIPEGSTICDMGCGEGEGTLEYSKVPGVSITAVDNSPVRLEMARERLKGRENVVFRQASVFDFDGKFDVVISQRMLVNLSSWAEQRVALCRLTDAVAPGGRLLLSEGSLDGADALNDFRMDMGLSIIPVPAHNLFMDDDDLLQFMDVLRWRRDGSSWSWLGTYYFLTRGVQPALRKDFDWNSDFNRRCAALNKAGNLQLEEFSRVKQWCFMRG